MNLTIKTSFLVIASALLPCAMTSCFTGIESTPKITASDVKKQNIPVKEEDSFLSEIKPQPFSEWEKGKRFYVSDDKFSLLTLPPASSAKELSGSVITYDSYTEISDISGNHILELTFFTEDGSSLSYRTGQTAAAIRKSDRLDIPFLVEMSVVDAVREKLEGKKYYIMTPSWYDTNRQAFQGRKFVPVTIKHVLPGNGVYSTILEMEDENGKPFILFLSVANDLKSLRGFSSLFSFTDPRKNFPQITDETWRNIINGKVAADMTRQECRLALGSPASVDRGVGYSSVREIWTYENGVYLIFEDNLLRSYRQ